jgi:hypothetical protein
MLHQVKITINVLIPKKDFSYEQQNEFIRATLALFKGMFPDAENIPPAPGSPSPVTVEVNDVEEL